MMDHPGPQETPSSTSPFRSPPHPAEGERAKGPAPTQRSPVLALAEVLKYGARGGLRALGLGLLPMWGAAPGWAADR